MSMFSNSNRDFAALVARRDLKSTGRAMGEPPEVGASSRSRLQQKDRPSSRAAQGMKREEQA